MYDYHLAFRGVNRAEYVEIQRVLEKFATQNRRIHIIKELRGLSDESLSTLHNYVKEREGWPIETTPETLAKAVEVILAELRAASSFIKSFKELEAKVRAAKAAWPLLFDDEGAALTEFLSRL